jgi:hypothetical protein
MVTVSQIPLEYEGKVIFTGGENYDDNVAYLNPTHAEPVFSSTGGEVVSCYWWIISVSTTGDGPLHEGGYDTLSQTLTALLATPGANGEYEIYFELTDETGAVYHMHRNFYILTPENDK